MPCYYFKYTPETGSPLYLEDEPIKWDAVKIKLKRDRDLHGVNYEYTDEDIALEFDCLSGSDFIEQIYQSQGGDGYIGFEFGYYNGLVEIPEYNGKINLATRKLLASYRISAMVEREGLHDQIKTRWGTKADLFSSVSIDGDVINAPTPLELELHSKVLINNYNKKTGVEGDFNWQPFIGDNKHDVWFVFNTQPENEVDSNIDATIGSLLGPTGDDPVTSGLALLFDLNVGGTFTFDIYLSYAFNIKLIRKLISAKPKIGDWYFDNWLEVRDLNGVLKTKTRIGSQISGNRDGQFLVTPGSQNWLGTLTHTADLVFGDRVYLYAHFNLDGYNAGWKGVEAYIKTYKTEINVSAETSTGVSSTKVLMIHETLTQAVAFVTGQDDAVYSEFFGREDLGYALTGCGAYKSITNGFQIRKFTTALQPPKLSPQEILTSMKNIFCLGMGYEQIGGQNKLRIEDRGYFYQDVEILFIPTIGDYKEEVANELVNNSIQIGYTKYLDEGLRLLDEYNTEHQYTTPIRNSDAPLDLRSTLIGSGYALEITRRAQYADTPKDSTKYDDDGFFIAVAPQSTGPISGIFVNDVGAYISYSGVLPMVLRSGDRIRISGTTLNNGEYTVMEEPTGNRIYLGVFAINTEVAPNITIENLTRPYQTEKDEAFTTVTGVVSPETSYNLRHTPKRNLLNHAKWLNGGMYYKSAGELVKNTFVKQNGELSTQLDTADSCPLGDVDYDLLQEKANVSLAMFQNKDRYYIPEWVSFKARLPMSDIRLLRDCLTGANLTGQNYGYVTCVNQDGNYTQSWVYDMTYNPFTEEVNFVCLKKDVILVNPPSPLVCSDYADFTFAQFEALPNLSIDIEQCRFNNFN